MSWVAHLLYDDVEAGDYGYTHNTNGMITKALDVLGKDCESAWWDRDAGTVWWKHLDGLDGEAGADFLAQIVGVLSEAPEMFREMDPPNGWGNYDGLMGQLVKMRDRGREHPAAVWSVWG